MVFTSVYVYKVAVRIILIYSTRGASDSAEDIYNNNSHSQGLKIGFQGQLLLNAGKKYCRMLQGEHSAILSTFIKLPFVIKIFVLSIFEWPFYTGLL